MGNRNPARREPLWVERNPDTRLALGRARLLVPTASGAALRRLVAANGDARFVVATRIRTEATDPLHRVRADR